MRFAHGDEATIRELEQRAHDLMRSDIVIWAHTVDWRVRAEHFRSIPRSASAIDVYWEADAYHPIFRPLPTAMASLACRASIVFILVRRTDADRLEAPRLRGHSICP